MMGHRGRHTLTLDKSPKKNQGVEESKSGSVDECPKCPPGSGKAKGHRGKCKGSKAPTPQTSAKDEEELSNLMDKLVTNQGDDDDDSSEDEVVPVTFEVSDSEESEDEGIELNEDNKVTIGETEYYKKDAQGKNDLIFSYPGGDHIGFLHTDGKTIVPVDDDSDDSDDSADSDGTEEE